MFYQQKKIITTIISGLLVLSLYCIYAIRKYIELGDGVLDDLVFWSEKMLIFIGINIIASIVILILFHILLSISIEVKKEMNKDIIDTEMDETEDEMDKLISLKASRNSYVIVGIGFVLALLSSYLGMPVAIVLNIIFISFMISSIFGDFSQLYYYKKGVYHG